MRRRISPHVPFIVRNADDGAGGGGTPPPADPPSDPPGDDDDDDTPLGPKGEKALAAMKAELKAAKARAKVADDLQAQLDAIQAANMTDHEKAIKDAADKAAADTRAAVLTDVNARLFTAELKAATSGVLLPAAAQDLLVKPDVALALLGLDEYPVTPTGDIDSTAIVQAVTAYAQSRPHLAASATLTPGSADLGARTTPTVKTTAQQIADAEAAGDTATALRLKSQQLLELHNPTR